MALPDHRYGNWRTTHGEDFDVPKEVGQLEGVEDLSWVNDENPSFGKQWNHGSADVRVWVEHPDPEQRMSPSRPRYSVTSFADDDEHAAKMAEAVGFPASDAGNAHFTGYQGDDPNEAARSLVDHVMKVQQVMRTPSRDRKGPGTINAQQFPPGRMR